MKIECIDSNRFVVVPVATVQEFRTQSIKIVDKYLEQSEKDRKPIMFVLDSLGMLSTTKEMKILPKVKRLEI